MISSNAVEKLLEVVPEGSTVLELGTGFGTKHFTEHYHVISIEDSPEWHQGVSELIQVPLAPAHPTRSIIKRFPTFVEWYDFDILQKAMEGRTYDAMVVDGPASTPRRPGFWQHRDFWLRVPTIFDDVHRSVDYQNARLWANYIEASKFEVFDIDQKKHFARVLP